MVRKPIEVPVIDLFGTSVRRSLVPFIVDTMDQDGRLSTGQFAERTGVGRESVRLNLSLNEGGHLLRYDLLNAENPDDPTTFYTKKDSRVMELLHSWPISEDRSKQDDNRPPLLSLFDSETKQRIFEFFMARADPEKAYSKNGLRDNGVGNHSTTGKYLPVFIEAGLVEEVEGKRGTRYRKSTNEVLESFLLELNEALYEAHQTTVKA